MEDAASLHDKTNFVFAVDMFAAELRKHRIQTGCLWIYIDDVRRHIATTRFQFLDVGGIRAKDVFLRCVGRERLRRFPDLIIDADFAQILHDLGFIPDRAMLFRYLKYRHILPFFFSVGLPSVVAPSSAAARRMPTKI